MGISDFLMLLTLCSAMTALATEAVKTQIGDGQKIPNNILAGIMSVIVAAIICSGYIILNGTEMTQQVWVYIVGLILLSWLCAMTSYDKVIQTIKQFGKLD